jgi:hypothetical protein
MAVTSSLTADGGPAAELKCASFHAQSIDSAPAIRSYPWPRNAMGKQSNKVEKRRRRLAYLERTKMKVKEVAGGNKAKLRRPVARKEKEKRPTSSGAEAPAPAASSSAPSETPAE